MSNQEYIKRIEDDIAFIKNQIPLIRKNNKRPQNLSISYYVWVIFTMNIVSQSEDLLTIIKSHSDKKIKLKNSLHTILRSILEDFFYLRFILVTNKKEEVIERFLAYKHSDSVNGKKHLNSLKSLEKKGKFIFSTDKESILSEEGLSQKIKDLEEEINSLENTYTDNEDFKSLCSSFLKVEEICKRYDEVKNINKIEEGKEITSLEWLYNYIYRFQSMYAHQSITIKEEVLDLIWDEKTYETNDEILGVLIGLFETIKQLKKNLN